MHKLYILCAIFLIGESCRNPMRRSMVIGSGLENCVDFDLDWTVEVSSDNAIFKCCSSSFMVGVQSFPSIGSLQYGIIQETGCDGIGVPLESNTCSLEISCWTNKTKIKTVTIRNVITTCPATTNSSSIDLCTIVDQNKGAIELDDTTSVGSAQISVSDDTENPVVSAAAAAFFFPTILVGLIVSVII